MIDVTVTDDVAVASVTVKISDEQGNLIESSLATENNDGSSPWCYSVQNTFTEPVTVEVVDADYPAV